MFVNHGEWLDAAATCAIRSGFGGHAAGCAGASGRRMGGDFFADGGANGLDVMV